MTTAPPWPTAATFPVSVRRREAGRIWGITPACGGPIAGLGSIRRPTRPRSPGPRKSGNTLDSKELANNRTSGKTMHVACYGKRYYDPLTGRWMSQDPIGEKGRRRHSSKRKLGKSGCLNLYEMVHNNPISKVDILGLEMSDAQEIYWKRRFDYPTPEQWSSLSEMFDGTPWNTREQSNDQEQQDIADGNPPPWLKPNGVDDLGMPQYLIKDKDDTYNDTPSDNGDESSDPRSQVPDIPTSGSADDDDRSQPRAAFNPSIYPDVCACLKRVKDAAINDLAGLQKDQPERSKGRADIYKMYGQRSWDCINYFGEGFHWGGGGETSLEDARKFWSGSPNSAVNIQTRK
ncbi:MAG: RHS repeat-associated core domain-containing protein [Verrucomicrobiota bacterium]